MADWYEGLIGLGRAVVSKSRLSNAAGIPLVFVTIVFLGGLLGYTTTRDDIFAWVMLIPIIFFVAIFFFFMIFRPEMLRTEEHEERMLQISSGMGQKDDEQPPQFISLLPDEQPDENLIESSSTEKGLKK